jgi:hypothetical protein
VDVTERCDEIRVTALQTGTANLKRLHEMGTAGRSPTERKLDILRDHEWAGPLPIYAYLVEHPQGASSWTPVTGCATPTSTTRPS